MERRQVTAEVDEKRTTITKRDEEYQPSSLSDWYRGRGVKIKGKRIQRRKTRVKAKPPRSERPKENYKEYLKIVFTG